MKPSYNELIQLNPRLKNRPKEDVIKLLNTIISKGYIWVDKKKYFYHEKLEMHIRTQGLDLFDPDRFERVFQDWSNPKFIKQAKIKLAHRNIPKILLVFIIDLLLGWFFIPIKIWIASLIFLLLLTFEIRDRARDKIKGY